MNCTILMRLRKAVYARFVRAGDALMDLCDALCHQTSECRLAVLDHDALARRAE